MNRKISRRCEQCQEYHALPFDGQRQLRCPECGHMWGEVVDSKNFFERCPLCDCRQFYSSKGFNQALGCLIMAIAIVLVPFTYGISLPVLAAVDWLLWRRVPTVINCYRCGAEFQNFDTQKSFKPFMHHIGLKYDKYR